MTKGRSDSSECHLPPPPSRGFRLWYCNSFTILNLFVGRLGYTMAYTRNKVEWCCYIDTQTIHSFLFLWKGSFRLSTTEMQYVIKREVSWCIRIFENGISVGFGAVNVKTGVEEGILFQADMKNQLQVSFINRKTLCFLSKPYGLKHQKKRSIRHLFHLQGLLHNSLAIRKLHLKKISVFENILPAIHLWIIIGQCHLLIDFDKWNASLFIRHPQKSTHVVYMGFSENLC